jgi:hypothetical protein
MKELHLSWTKVKGVTTDGAPSMTGMKTGPLGRIRREMDKQNTEFYMELHCIIHQQSLGGKTLKSEHIMNVVVSDVNFIQFRRLNLLSTRYKLTLFK